MTKFMSGQSPQTNPGDDQKMTNYRNIDFPAEWALSRALEFATPTPQTRIGVKGVGPKKNLLIRKTLLEQEKTFF